MVLPPEWGCRRATAMQLAFYTRCICIVLSEETGKADTYGGTWRFAALKVIDGNRRLYIGRVLWKFQVLQSVPVQVRESADGFDRCFFILLNELAG